MRGKVKVGVAIAASTLLVLTLGTSLWLNRPFKVELGLYRTSLAHRSTAQRLNIKQAAIALNGVVIEPGDTWSFNETVGPRTAERGYVNAPAFMERDLVSSIGGGICQVSSTVYNAAALAGLLIVERHPHFRRVDSVPPGRDATVWYGMADLRLRNPFSHPVRLSLYTSDNSLKAVIDGSPENRKPVRIYSMPVEGPSVFRTMREQEVESGLAQIEVLSWDTYSH